ncbi:P-loop ATPase, Sll1717 family [Rhizobium sp. IMFF44]|uniref:P-loop ATPase, Sll1717 family n=1 Tax=Rhizobium sp. IMFF44 TaxID=3342350 RepID=UPI0035B76B6B
MLQFDDLTVEHIFGADDAENENPERFKQYFYRNRAFESLISPLPVRILVGHKGVGKSALLRRAFMEDEDSNRVAIWLKPNDIVDIKTEASGHNDFILKIEAWKKGLLLEIIERVFTSVYGEGSRSVLDDVRSAKPKELLKLLQRTLSESTNEQFVNVYIDDIDRGWSASVEDIRTISALLNAIRDIGGEYDTVRFRIGLRSDVYFLVRTSDESTDKIERNVVWLRWDNDAILRVAAKRIVSYFAMPISDDQIDKMSQRNISERILSKVIDPRFQGRGRWEDRPTHTILMSLTRARPRDLVKLFHLSAKNAYVDRSTIIHTAHLEAALEPYSQERLQDIINEYKSEVPQIERLLLEMRPSTKERRTAESFQFNTAELRQKINNALNHVNVTFSNGRIVNSGSIIQFMYKIDFITARKQIGEEIDRKYFSEGRFLAPEFADFGYDWEIHPAYRWALQPQGIQDILANLFK